MQASLSRYQGSLRVVNHLNPIVLKDTWGFLFVIKIGIWNVFVTVSSVWLVDGRYNMAVWVWVCVWSELLTEVM